MTEANATDLPTVLNLPDGMRWVALRTLDAGKLAGRMTETAVGLYVKNDLLPDGGMRHTRAYYGLLDAATPDHMPVVAATGGPGEFGDEDGPQVVGFRNADPYTTFHEEIAALAKEVGAELPRECYTMRGRGNGASHEAVLDGSSLRNAERIATTMSRPLSEVLGMLVVEALAARDVAGRD